MEEPTELQRIDKRIRSRDSANRKDRTRQRQLIREGIASGSSWDQVQREASVSRPTIGRYLKRDD